MKNTHLIYYKTEDGNEAIEINYDRLYHDHYTKEGVKRWCLGAANDRIEEFFVRRNHVKITKSKFDKLVEKYANQD